MELTVSSRPAQSTNKQFSVKKKYKNRSINKLGTGTLRRDRDGNLVGKSAQVSIIATHTVTRSSSALKTTVQVEFNSGCTLEEKLTFINILIAKNSKQTKSYSILQINLQIPFTFLPTGQEQTALLIVGLQP